MKLLTYDFSKTFFRRLEVPDEDACDYMDRMEEEINHFIAHAKTLYVGNGVNIRYMDGFKVILDTSAVEENNAFTMFVYDGGHEAAMVVVKAGQRLKLKQLDNDTVAIKVEKTPVIVAS